MYIKKMNFHTIHYNFRTKESIILLFKTMQIKFIYVKLPNVIEYHCLII